MGVHTGCKGGNAYRKGDGGAMLLDRSTCVLQGGVQWEVYGNVHVNVWNIMHDQVTFKKNLHFL